MQLNQHVINPAQSMRPFGFDDSTQESPVRVVSGFRATKGELRQMRRLRNVGEVSARSGNLFAPLTARLVGSGRNAVTLNRAEALGAASNNTAVAPPPFEFVTEWDLADEGFIAGGQNGAQRTYNDPTEVAASPWSFVNIQTNQLSLRLDFEDDYNCAGYNINTQTAWASVLIRTLLPQVRMFISWEGLGETEDPGGSTDEIFEQMRLSVNGTEVARAHAPGGGLGCAGGVAPVVSDPPSPFSVILSEGEHNIDITASTNDPRYHVGAYYQFTLSFIPV